ncbi:MAG: hypothetical protein IJ186_01610 [Bacilli bacterium]|nr:hypothetical protein [Bacilli bacterium]
MKKFRFFSLLRLFPLLCASCSTSGQATPAEASSNYAKLRYTYNYDYKNYCYFPANAGRLIDASINEALLTIDGYSKIEVSKLNYKKSASLSNDEISSLKINDGKIVSEAEKGTLYYHWIMETNEKGKSINLPEVDQDYSEDVTTIKIDQKWFVYITIH